MVDKIINFNLRIPWEKCPSLLFPYSNVVQWTHVDMLMDKDFARFRFTRKCPTESIYSIFVPSLPFTKLLISLLITGRGLLQTCDERPLILAPCFRPEQCALASSDRLPVHERQCLACNVVRLPQDVSRCDEFLISSERGSYTTASVALFAYLSSYPRKWIL